MEMKNELTPAQMTAIKFNIEQGYHLQKRAPELVNLVKSDRTREEMIEALGLGKEYPSAAASTLFGILYYSLYGYGGEYPHISTQEPYEGAVPVEDLRDMVTRKRLGVHRPFGRGAWSLEDIKKHDAIMREQKIGIHGLTPDQKEQRDINSVLGQGHLPISPDELEFLYQAIRNPEWLHFSGSHKGKPNIKMLADALNDGLYQGLKIRSEDAVWHMIRIITDDGEDPGCH